MAKQLKTKVQKRTPGRPKRANQPFLTYIGLAIPALVSIFALSRAGEHYEPNLAEFAEAPFADVETISIPRDIADKADAFRISQMTHREAQAGVQAGERDLSQIKETISTASREHDKILEIMKKAKKDFEREAKLHPISAEQRAAFEALQAGRQAAITAKLELLETVRGRLRESEKVLQIAKNNEKQASNERKRRKTIIVKSIEVYMAECCRPKPKNAPAATASPVPVPTPAPGTYEVVDITMRRDDSSDDRELKSVLRKAICKGVLVPLATDQGPAQTQSDPESEVVSEAIPDEITD